MALFLSTFENKVDQKGRVSVPAQFRNTLNSTDFSGVIVYQSSINECIEGCDINRIRKISESIDDMDPLSRERDYFATVILGGSAQLPFDSDGRIILPKHLMDFAKIKDKAIFIGKGNIFEIWEIQKYNEYLKKAQSEIKNKPFSYNKKVEIKKVEK